MYLTVCSLTGPSVCVHRSVIYSNGKEVSVCPNEINHCQFAKPEKKKDELVVKINEDIIKYCNCEFENGKVLKSICEQVKKAFNNV